MVAAYRYLTSQCKHVHVYIFITFHKVVVNNVRLMTNSLVLITPDGRHFEIMQIRSFLGGKFEPILDMVLIQGYTTI